MPASVFWKTKPSFREYSPFPIKVKPQICLSVLLPQGNYPLILDSIVMGIKTTHFFLPSWEIVIPFDFLTFRDIPIVS